MSTLSDVIQGLKTVIEDGEIPNLKNVYLGDRENIPDSYMPCIIIEPIDNVESDLTYPTQEILMTVAVIGFIKVYNVETQVTDLLEFENNIKRVISENKTFDVDGVITTRIKSTQYDRVHYPVRGFVLEIEIELRQNSLTR